MEAPYPASLSAFVPVSRVNSAYAALFSSRDAPVRLPVRVTAHSGCLDTAEGLPGLNLVLTPVFGGDDIKTAHVSE